jgi:hypothetical protein
VDTGNFLSDEKSSHGMMAGFAVTKNDWVLKAYDRFKVDVVNLSGQDLGFVSSRLGPGSGENTLGALLGRIVSANTTFGTTDQKTIRPYTVLSLPDRKSSTRSQVRIAFVGISDDQKQPAPGLKVQDAIESAKRIVPQARGEADLVIVLAHVSNDIATRIAQEVPGVDAVIAGNGKEFTLPATVGRVSVVFTPYETRMLGELRFYRGPDGRYAVKSRFIGLDNTIPDDKQAAAFVTESKLAVKKEVERFTRPMEAAAPGLPGKGQVDSNFVSAQTCLECHRAEYMTWSNTAHARAINSLATKAAELDSGCLACHTTGFNRGGFQNIAETRTLVNVQCEECHGPGRAHIAKPDKTYGRIADLQSVCSRCHTAETSAEFNPAAFWAKIKH